MASPKDVGVDIVSFLGFEKERDEYLKSLTDKQLWELKGNIHRDLPLNYEPIKRDLRRILHYVKCEMTRRNLF